MSGAFTVENGAAVISNTGTTITTGDISAKNIKLSATASYLNFAVPSGTFTNFKITITDTNGKTYSLSAASLTLNRAMVNKVTFALDAKDPAVFEVNVNGHTVRIKLTDDITAHDVLTEVYVEGSSVIVNAWSKSGKHLKCTMPDGEFCTSQSKTENLVYTFTISDITENTTATIGYAESVSSITISPADVDCKVAIIGGELYEGETVRIVPKAAYSYGISNWKDQNGGVLSDGYDYTVRLSQDVQITACFEENLILDGEFTVDNNGRTVRFTRGNLYRIFDGCKIEQHQYDFNSANYTDDFDHVSHFMWSSFLSLAASKKYSDSWKAQTPFFANGSNFTVSGFSEAGTCFALSKDEWSYLFTARGTSTVNGTENAKYFKGCINKEDGKSMNGLFIFPDEFTWPASVEARPSGINEASADFTNTYTYNDFKRLQDAGIVFLPAAGSRIGDGGSTSIDGVGDGGNYWSASTIKDNYAFEMCFYSSNVIPSRNVNRSQAFSVRLVTESN